MSLDDDDAGREVPNDPRDEDEGVDDGDGDEALVGKVLRPKVRKQKPPRRLLRTHTALVPTHPAAFHSADNGRAEVTCEPENMSQFNPTFRKGHRPNVQEIPFR